MRNLLIVGAVMVSALSVERVEAAQPRVVAVFDIRDLSERLDAKALENLTAYFTSQLDRGATLRTVSRADIRSAIQRLKSESYKECYDERCQIEVGKEVAAEYSVLTQIVAIGTKCAVTATMYNLRTATSERTASEKSACDVDALVNALERAAHVLEGTGESPPVATAQPVPKTSPPPPPPTAESKAASPPPQQADPPAPTSASTVAPKSAGLPVLPIVTIGVGAAVAATGLTFLVLANGHADDANDMQVVGAQFDAESAAQKNTIGTILLTAGGAVVAAGAALWILSGPDDEAVALIPTVTPDGAFAQVMWSY